jgi:Concanavalin A-like lectin/glucanases superfamily
MSTYYVAAAGSNSNTGLSPAQAFATFTHAASVVSQGDTVLGNGGDTITENPSFSVGVTLGSYGTGQCTIAGGTTAAVTFVACSNWTINNLILTNSYTSYTSGPQVGVVTFSPSTASTTYSNIAITNCTISGFLQGIRIVAGSTTTLIQGITITGNTFGPGVSTGLVIGGSGTKGTNWESSNITITGNTFASIIGSPNISGSGNAMTLQFCNTTAGAIEISGNIIHDLAASSGAANYSSGYGVQFEGTNGAVIEKNLFYNIFDSYTGGGTIDDGGCAIDIDNGYSANNTVRYNYAFNCGGPFLEAYSGGSGNLVYCNIAINMGMQSTKTGGLWIGGDIDTTAGGFSIYNNLITTGNKLGVVNCAAGDASNPLSGTKILNNCFISPAGAPSPVLPSNITGLVMDGNYHQNGDGTFLAKYNGTSYTTLSGWQGATSLEPAGVVGGHCYFVQPQPMALTQAAAGINCSPVSGSPLLNAGANLSGTYSITPPTDYNGNSWTQNTIGPIYLAGTPTNYATAVYADDPKVWFRLAEASGTSFSDTVGTLPVGTWTSVTLGEPTLTPGDGGTSVLCNGSSSEGDIPQNITTYTVTSISVEAWFKLSTVTGVQIIFSSFNSPQSDNSIHMHVNGTTLTFYVTGGTSGQVDFTVPGFTFATNTIYHVVCTVTGTTGTCYINAVSQTPSYVTQTSLVGGIPILNSFIGSNQNGGQNLNGYEANVAIYPTVLSSTRIGEHYAAGTFAAGTATVGTETATTIAVSATDATGGAGSNTYQWQISSNNTTWTNMTGTGTTTRSATATGLTASTTYYFRLQYTDANSNTVYSLSVSGTTTAATGGTTGGAALIMAAA